MKQLQGTVIRVNDEHTAKVEVSRQWKHPVYKKYVKRTKSYLADIPSGVSVRSGDEVPLWTSCAYRSGSASRIVYYPEKREA